MLVITMQKLICGMCGATRLAAWAGICRGSRNGRLCGAEVWVLPEKPRPTVHPGISVRRLDPGEELRPIRFDSQLSEALDGICIGLSVLIAGLPGAGKSTLVAELAAAMANKLDGVIWWVDREQVSHALIAACFARTNSPMHRVQVVGPTMGATISNAGWREALAAVEDDPKSILVCDSLQTWGDHRETEMRALLGALRSMRCTSLIISHSNQEGDPFGATTNQHGTDAVAIVTPTRIEVPEKCRWAKTPRSFARRDFNSK